MTRTERGATPWWARAIRAAVVAGVVGVGNPAMAKPPGGPVPDESISPQRYSSSDDLRPSRRPDGGAPDDGKRLKALLGDLESLADEAEKRSADRWLIRDLRRLVKTYQVGWRRAFLWDDFRDGDYKRDPAWSVDRGGFEVDPRFGLVTAVGRYGWVGRSGQGGRSQYESMVDQWRSSDRPGRWDREAQIHSDVRGSGPFVVELDFWAFSDKGQLEISVERDRGGPSAESAYLLSIRPGPDGRAELIDVSPRGTTVLASAALPRDFDREDRHSLRWTLGRDGYMEVAMDRHPPLRTRERVRLDRFDRLSIVNRGGYFAFREVGLYGD